MTQAVTSRRRPHQAVTASLSAGAPGREVAGQPDSDPECPCDTVTVTACGRAGRPSLVSVSDSVTQPGPPGLTETDRLSLRLTPAVTVRTFSQGD